MKWIAEKPLEEANWSLIKKRMPFEASKLFAGPYKSVSLNERELFILYEQKGSKALAELANLPGFQSVTLKELKKLTHTLILKETIPSQWKNWSDKEYFHFRDFVLKESKKQGLEDDSIASLSSFMEQLRGNSQARENLSLSPKQSSLCTAKNFPELKQDTGVVKIKVQNHELDELFRELEVRALNTPKLMFRLDGNRQLDKTLLRELFHNSPASLRNRIQYIEEPFATTEDHLELTHQLPLALDESLRDFQYGKCENTRKLKDLIAQTQFFVCKPLLHGGPYSTQKLYESILKLQSEHVDQNEKKVHFIVSHCFEGPIGLEWNKVIAMGLDPQRKEYHGIDWNP